MWYWLVTGQEVPAGAVLLEQQTQHTEAAAAALTWSQHKQLAWWWNYCPVSTDISPLGRDASFMMTFFALWDTILCHFKMYICNVELEKTTYLNLYYRCFEMGFCIIDCCNMKTRGNWHRCSRHHTYWKLPKKHLAQTHKSCKPDRGHWIASFLVS